MSHELVFKKGIMFDLDGTLVNTLPDIATSINLARQAMGFDPMKPGDITCHVGNGTVHLVRQTIPVPEAQFEEAHNHYLSFYMEHMLDESELNPGAEEILHQFADRSLAVITNKPQNQTEKILAGLGVRDSFRVVLGGDALEKKKPDPLPLLHYMKQEGLSPDDVVMVGDGVNDIRAAHAAGVLAIGVTLGVSTLAELKAEKPAGIIEELTMLQEWIC